MSTSSRLTAQMLARPAYRKPLPVDWQLNQRYRILGELHSGPQCVLYDAEDMFLGRPVAVKEFFPFVMPRATAGNMVPMRGWTQDQIEGAVASFIHTAELQARIRHPGTVRVHDLVQQHDTAYLVMERVEGPSLETLMYRRLDDEEVEAVTNRLVTALEAVHREEVVHMEVSPENILLREGRPILIDFSGAHGTGEHVLDNSMFSEPYGAPEILGDEPARATRAADIYSLSVIIHQLLTQRLPRRGRVSEQVPPRWRALLERGLRPRPVVRGSDIVEWWSLLDG